MKKIAKIEVEVIPDYDADLSYLGTFDAEPKGEHAIEHEPNDPSTHNWFNCQTGMEEYAQREYERMLAYDRGEWGMVGVKAVAEIQISDDGKNWLCNEVASGGLWGIENDGGEDYIKEVGRDQVSELRDMLLELGFTAKEIGAVEVIEIEL